MYQSGVGRVGPASCLAQSRPCSYPPNGGDGKRVEGGKGAGERGEGRERDGIEEERGEGWMGDKGVWG